MTAGAVAAAKLLSPARAEELLDELHIAAPVD